VTGNTSFNGTVSGIPIGGATQAAIDVKADTSYVDLMLGYKANINAPTFGGRVTTERLTVNEDTTLSGDLDVSGTGKMIIARRIAPPPFSTLALGGAVTVEGALVVGTTNVLNAINNISLTPGPTGPQGIQGIQGLTGPAPDTSLYALNASPTFSGTVTTEELVVGTALANKNLTVNGNLEVLGNVNFANPYWVAVVINFTGGIPTIVRNGGRNAATSLIRVSGQATGQIQFDFPTHPQGTTYIVSSSAVAGYGTILTSVRSSTRIGISMRNTVNQLFDTEAHVLILAY
jgi:hypothetical protein